MSLNTLALPSHDLISIKKDKKKIKHSTEQIVIIIIIINWEETLAFSAKMCLQLFKLLVP